MKVKQSEFYVIRGLGMTNYLVRQGHDIKKVQDNLNNRYFKVFYFKDSEKLRKDIKNYQK